MEKVAAILADHFKKWGITHVFGIPGKAVVPLLLAIDQKEIEFVLSKHESGAGYEATGYSLLSEKIGVAVGTSGPGGTNLITAAAQAKASHIPILIITGHPSMKDTGKAQGQDSTLFGTDLVDLFKPVTKFSARVERGDLLKAYLTHALEKAYSGVKGPVHLTIPADVLMEEIQPFSINLPIPQEMLSPKLHEVIDLLEKAQNPVLFLGKGVHSSKAYEEIRLLAEHWNIPVVTTPGGKGTFLSRHPLSLGAFGLGGTEKAHHYFNLGIDLMVVMGTKLSDMSLAGLHKEIYPKQVIHFDYEQTFVGKSLEVPTLFVSGDIKANAKEILRIVRAKDNQFDQMDPEKNELELEVGEEQESFISARKAISVMNHVLPEESILFGDDGSHTFYAIQGYDIKRTGTFFFDDVFGAMGHAIGYSIGAKLAAPNKKVICLTGDGCMLMQGTEVSTAVNAHAAVIFIVLNNSVLDMVDKGMKAHVGKAVGTALESPVQIANFAASMGATSYTCRTSAHLKESLERALEREETTVIEVIVDHNEIPPTMRRG